jgi:glycosyltransferase involved in cell wall biosynthesis
VRVGVLTTSYPRDRDDAAGAFVAGFARWLARHVGDVEVVCAGERQPLFYDNRGHGGAPSLLSASPSSWRHAARFSAQLFVEAARRVRRWDAIVSHWLVPSSAIAELLGRRRPHLAIAHGSDARLLPSLPGGRALLRRIARRAELVYVADALRVAGAPGRVAPMGIDAAAFASGDAERARARAALGVDGFVVAFVGRLIRDKGCDLALAGLPRDATLLVAGDGPERARLAELAASTAGSRARLLGHLRGAALRALYAAADAVVIPSRSDGAPTVALEAMAAARPIVATRAGGLPELLSDGKTALLSDPEPRAIRDALERLQKNTQLRQALADNARHEAREHDWSAAGPRLWGKFPMAPLRDGQQDRCIEIIRV